jgi:exopolysaccharide production protein ExoZ
MTEGAHAAPAGVPAGGGKLDSIQYLRAVAAAAVVVSHSANSLLGRTSHLIDLDYGAYGVDVFFVVSGFVMFYTTYGAPMRPGTFFVKRLIRIFPLYFILSTAMLVLVALSPSSFNQESADLAAYLQSVFFIPHWNPRLHNLEPIIGQGWTLNYEMFFYVLFAASLFIRHRLKGLAVLPLLGALVVAGRLHPIEHPMYITYTSTLLMEFGLGIVVAASFLAPARPGLRQPLALMLLLAAATAYLYGFHADAHASESARPLFVGVPAALLVTGTVAVERYGSLARAALLGLVGDASYSLYLVHGFVLGFGKRLWRSIAAPDTVPAHALFIVLVLAASIAIAVLLYRHVERKLGRILNAALRLNQARSGGAPAHRAVIQK